MHYTGKPTQMSSRCLLAPTKNYSDRKLFSLASYTYLRKTFSVGSMFSFCMILFLLLLFLIIKNTFLLCFQMTVNIHKYTTCTSSVCGRRSTGYFRERPDGYVGDTRRPNADSTYAAQDPYLRGQYHQ